MKWTTIAAGSVIFTIILGTAAGLAIWKRRAMASEAGKQGHEPAAAVEIVVSKEISWQPTAELVGTVLATQWVNLSNEVGGTIKEMTFESGAIVEKGQLLIQLDDSTEQASLARHQASVRALQASVKVAEARLRLAETDMKRFAAAERVNVAIEAEIDKASAMLEEAVASRARAIADVEEAQTQVEEARTLIAKKVIKAPFRGRVGLRNIHPGQFLKEGENVVMLQEVGDTIYLDFAVPQEYVARVKVGMTVMATSPVLGPEPEPITVVAMDATVDNSTRNVRIRSVVDNKGERLRPGMFIDIRVPADVAKTYVVVPQTAVRRASFSDHVYVVAKGSKEGELRAAQRFIKLGPAVGEDVIVLEGLKAGEEIASTGSFKLRDGALVMKVAPGSTSKPQATHGGETNATK